jgi:SAM-dependent methyltransferase
VREVFARTASLLELEQVQLVPQRLQCGGATFDVVFLHASINHLDEDACVGLRHNRKAEDRYREILRKLAALTRPGGKLIAFDCSSRNLFAHLRLKNPFAPTVEWQKHHPPRLWVRWLEEAGFERPQIRWHSFNTFRSPGRMILANRIAPTSSGVTSA